MNKYEVDFSYVEPVFRSLEVDAKDADEAEFFAIEEIKQTYPEAQDIEIEMVKLI